MQQPEVAREGVTAVVGGGAGEQLEEASLTAACSAGQPAPAAVPCEEQG